MIRDRLPSIQNLALAVRLLRFLTCNNQTKHVSKKQIVDLWKDIRNLFKTRAAPSLRRLQEALAKDAKKPTDDWIDWFRELAGSEDRLDAPEVGAIAGAFDGEMDNAQHVLAQLPPRFRKALGPDFGFQKQPWAICARLRSGNKRIFAGGGTHLDRWCNRWQEIKPLLKCSDWVIEWPNATSIHQRVHYEVEACEERGDLDFSATLEEVKTSVHDILEEERPFWISSDDSVTEARCLSLLKQGALQLPSQITPVGLRQAVLFYFSPLEVQSQLIEQAIEDLFEEEKIRSETIVHIPFGSNTPVPQVIYWVVQFAAEVASVSLRIPPLDTNSANWIPSTNAAELEGITAGTLRGYRCYDARWVAPDKMSGIDRDDRKWRRRGTPKSRPYYYVPSLRINREK